MERSEGRDASPALELKRVAAGGVGWEGLSLVLGKTLLLISTLILARLLSPPDFGVVAVALVFIEYAGVIADLSVAEAVIYLPPDDRTNDSALTLSIVWSLFLAGAAMLAAPAVGSFFHRPDITTMVRVLSLSLFLRGTAEVPDALLSKHLLFRRRLRATLARGVAQGLISIGLAIAGLGPWAIVIGLLSGDVLWNVAVWSVVDYRPSRRFWRLDAARVRPLLAFGIPAAGTALALTLLFNIDYLIVGRRLGVTALGFYTLAFRIPELLLIRVFYMLSRVAFPLFTRTRSDPARLRRGYLASVRVQTAYAALAGVGLAITAPMAVHVVFGAKWDSTIIPLEALALYAAFRSLDAIDVYKGIGRPGLAVKISLLRLAALAPTLWYATRFGIEGVSWAQAGMALLMVVAMQWVAGRLLGASAADFATALRPAGTLAAATAIGAGLIRLFLPGSELLRLLAAIVSGGALGLGALLLIERAFVLEVRGLLRRRGTAGAAGPVA